MLTLLDWTEHEKENTSLVAMYKFTFPIVTTLFQQVGSRPMVNINGYTLWLDRFIYTKQ